MGLEGFDVRPIFVSKLLNNSGVSPITGTETLIAKNKKILLKIEEDFSESINGTLLSLLNKVSPYVNYRDSIFFLLDCYDEDMALTAVQALEAAYERRKSLNANDLMEIIKESIETGVPASLIVNLLGNEEDDSIENLDLDSLSNNLHNLNHLKNTGGLSGSKTSKNNSTSTVFNKSGLNLDGMRDFK